MLVSGEVREQPELDLRVVAGEKQASLRHRERLPHAVAELRAGGDVLQVGVRAREATGGRHRLVERGVDAAVARHERGERVEVGALDLGSLAVVQDLGHDSVLVRQVAEDLRVGGVEAALGALEAEGGKPEHVEEHVGELLRGVDVEVLPGGGVDLLDHALDLRVELGRLGGEDARVHAEAHALHLGEHRQKGHLHVAEEPRGAVALHALGERRHEQARAHRVERRLGELVARGGKGLGEVRLGELRGPEGAAIGVEQVGGHGDVEDAGGVDLAGGEELGLGGVGGGERVDERLDVAGGHAPLAQEPCERPVGHVALETEEPLAVVGPQDVREAEERPVDAVVVERHADPAVPHGRVERRERVVGDERGGQLHAGGGGLASLAQRLARGGDGVLAGKPDEARGHAREAERRERAGDLGRVEGGEARVGEVELDRRVGADRGHAAAHQRVVDVGAQVLPHLALDLVRVRDDLVEAAVLHDEGGRLLGADARHAGDVVRGVALEAVEVGHELGRDAVVEVLHRGGVHYHHVRHALLGGDDLHVVRGELVHVAVPGEEEHGVARRLAAARQRAEDVVALPALELGDRHVERAEELLHHGELLVKRRVHRRPLGLVLGKHLHADARLALVEGADHAVGAEGVNELDEHVEEAEERVRGASVRRAHGLANRMERAVHEGVAVDDGDGAGIGHVLGHRSPLVLVVVPL